jgi:hypothetical protein
MYAVIESFEPVPHEFGDPGANDNNEAFSNDLVGRFIRTERIIDGQPHPNLYLVHVDSIISPVVGIVDVPPSTFIPKNPQPQLSRRGRQNCHRRNQIVREREHFLFLLHRRSRWSACWEGVIRNLHRHGQNGDETTEPENSWSDNNN